MQAIKSKRTILFDLDGTLFDHYYPLKNGILAIQEKLPDYFAHFELQHLIKTYDTALDAAYRKYLEREISYEEKDLLKVRIFFRILGIHEPNESEIQEFIKAYGNSYLLHRRATPGSIETLVRLRESGFQLGILTNGQRVDQSIRAQVIGIRQEEITIDDTRVIVIKKIRDLLCYLDIIDPQFEPRVKEEKNRIRHPLLTLQI